MANERMARRAKSFGRVADAYAAARPAYPVDAVRWAVGDPPGVVVDLAAGTGKLTVALTDAGYDVVAVEPSAEMLARLRSAAAGVPVVAGRAERLPLSAASAGAVAVGQAWHWFDPVAALDEVARVLRRGGALALLWNEREPVPWVTAVWATLSPAGMDLLDTDWAAAIAGHRLFGPLRNETFRHEQVLTRPALLDLVASRSAIAMLSPERRAVVLRRVEDVLDAHPDTAGRDSYVLPYATRCYRAVRR